MNPAHEEKIQVGNDSSFHCLSHIQYNKKGFSIQPHYHNYIEIIYDIEGDNEVCLNDSHYAFKTGDLVLINSGYVHSFSCGDGCYMVLRFDPDLLYSSSQSTIELKYILPFILNSFEHQVVFTKEELENANICHLLFEIYEEYQKQKYGWELSIRSKINEIFLWFLRHWHNQNINIELRLSSYEHSAKWLHKVFSYVSKNYGSDINAQQMAELCSMSYSYFSRTFKKIMKKSFSEYLTYVRINEAEKLLMTTDMNITEIAMQTGFSTSSYFIQQFKSIKNISPKQYRKNNKI